MTPFLDFWPDHSDSFLSEPKRKIEVDSLFKAVSSTFSCSYPNVSASMDGFSMVARFNMRQVLMIGVVLRPQSTVFYPPITVSRVWSLRIDGFTNRTRWELGRKHQSWLSSERGRAAKEQFVFQLFLLSDHHQSLFQIQSFINVWKTINKCAHCRGKVWLWELSANRPTSQVRSYLSFARAKTFFFQKCHSMCVFMSFCMWHLLLISRDS